MRLLKAPPLEFRGLALPSAADYLLKIASKSKYALCEHINPGTRAYLTPIKDDIRDDIFQFPHVFQLAFLVRKGPVVVDCLASQLTVAGFDSE